MIRKTVFNSIYLTIRLKYSFKQQILEFSGVFLGNTVTLEVRGDLTLGAYVGQAVKASLLLLPMSCFSDFCIQ